VISLLHLLITIYIWVLILDALLSWFPASGSGALASVKDALRSLTDPVLRPLRSLIPSANFGGMRIDFTVWIAIIVLRLLNGAF